MKGLEKIKNYLPNDLYEKLKARDGVEFDSVKCDLKVYGNRGLNHYKIKLYYNKRHEDSQGEWWTLEGFLLDEFELTWDEIESQGGIEIVNKQLIECYGI